MLCRKSWGRRPEMNRTLLVALFTTLIATACTSRTGSGSAVFASGLGGGSEAAKNTWVTYDDPGEHAFTIEVPQGWSVQGGMYRFGYFDVRGTVDMRSPD